MPLREDDRLRFGACWSPDQWPRDRWREDLELMRDAGLSCVRWGEGSWATHEPEQGAFDWSLLDDVLASCAEFGIGVILATPTAAPPAWLIERHPHVVAQCEVGPTWTGHGRRAYNYTDADYQRCSAAIVSALAERYAQDDRVWAWQLDDHVWSHGVGLWGDQVRAAFHLWLRQRYSDLAALNHAWGLVWHSNTLNDFEHAELPGMSVAEPNQHQLADYYRFLSDAVISFLDNQKALIKQVNDQAVVMHNAPSWPVDRAELLSRLDVGGHNHYPRLAQNAQARPAFGMNYGKLRPYAKRLWAVEQQTSQVGSPSFRKPTSPPGELSVAALQSVAHGCNLVTWCRWRSFPAAQEVNGGGLLPHWGQPGRHYQEAKEFVGVLAPHAETIAQTKPYVRVARLNGFAQNMATEVEPWLEQEIGGSDVGRGALINLALNEDTIRPRDLVPSDQYEVAIMPYAVALEDADLNAMEAWVAAGGSLVVGPMAGHRDVSLQAAWHREPPGPLARLTGTRNGEATTTREPVQVLAADGGHQFSATTYAEIVEPVDQDAKIIARHSTGWLATRGAIVERQFGEGKVIHCGIALTEPVLEWLWTDGALARPKSAIVTHESGAEIITRANGSYALHFALNHGNGPAVYYLYRPVTDLITGEPLTNSFTLNGYGWRILREDFDS